MARTLEQMFPGQNLPLGDIFLRPNPTFPLKEGDELFEDLPDAEVNQDLQFAFDVAIDEPQIVQAESLPELLVQFTGPVDGVVAALAAELA